MRVLHVVAESPVSFLQNLKEISFIERKPLKFCAERLASLVKTLEIPDIPELGSLQQVASFATLVSSYTKGFTLILEYVVLTNHLGHLKTTQTRFPILFSI
jgi:DNA excision repair protein ERCC-2